LRCLQGTVDAGCYLERDRSCVIGDVRVFVGRHGDAASVDTRRIRLILDRELRRIELALRDQIKSGRVVLEVLFAAYESARTGQRVAFPFTTTAAKPIDLWKSERAEP